MDQRSEREVHNQMVRITCHKDAGQFFLLTPKLLTGLDYHERMRVLVVCNGEWRTCSSWLSLVFSWRSMLTLFLARISSGTKGWRYQEARRHLRCYLSQEHSPNVQGKSRNNELDRLLFSLFSGCILSVALLCFVSVPPCCIFMMYTISHHKFEKRRVIRK